MQEGGIYGGAEGTRRAHPGQKILEGRGYFGQIKVFMIHFKLKKYVFIDFILFVEHYVLLLSVSGGMVVGSATNLLFFFGGEQERREKVRGQGARED